MQAGGGSLSVPGSGPASIYDVSYGGPPAVETYDYEKLKKRLGRITCLVLTVSMAMTFAAFAFVYQMEPAGVKPKETDIGRWSGSGNSTASIKMCTRNQAFLVWINGHLVATGQECDLEFLKDHRGGGIHSRKQVHIDAPCEKPLTVAIEAQDFEFGSNDTSKGGIVGEINWCGTKILTGVPGVQGMPADPDRIQWECSTSAPEQWMKPCPNVSNDVTQSCGRLSPFRKALAERHLPGTAHCPIGECSDDQQAHDEKISETAEWIWAGSVPEDFKVVDSAYCRVTVACHQHSCKAPITVGGCSGPGPNGAPGYAFREDKSVTYSKPWTPPDETASMAMLFEEEELGQVMCSDGYALARPVVKTCDPNGARLWKFDGCCADFLWFIPATNYFIAFLAFVLMSYLLRAL